MFVNNYYKFLARVLNGQISSTDTTSYPYVVDLDNNTISRDYYEVANIFDLNWGTHFSVGSDNTPTQASDYNLHNEISNISISVTSLNTYNSDYEKTFLLNIVNNNSSTVEINEIGFIKNLRTSGSYVKYTMFFREVLNETLNMGANESKAIAITIKIK